MVPNWIVWPKEVDQKNCSFYQRNIQYRARLKGPPFQFFSALWVFFLKKISPKGPPSIFWGFTTKWMMKIPKDPIVSLSVFSALWDFFFEKKFNKGSSPFKFAATWVQFRVLFSCFREKVCPNFKTFVYREIVWRTAFLVCWGIYVMIELVQLVEFRQKYFKDSYNLFQAWSTKY